MQVDNTHQDEEEAADAMNNLENEQIQNPDGIETQVEESNQQVNAPTDDREQT